MSSLPVLICQMASLLNMAPPDPKFIQQINQLISTATGWLTGIAITAAVCMIIYAAIMHMFSQDASAAAEAKKKMKTVLILSVVVVIASQAVNYLKDFFA